MIFFNCIINDQIVKAFLDTGADITCISRKLFNKLKIDLKQNSVINIRQLDNTTTSLGCVLVHLQIGKIQHTVKAHVIRNLNTDLLLGLDTIQLFNLKLNLNNNQLT